ncbi:MAG TPA: 4-phosphoerythronate dehydrogenase [Fibrobacteria bacterium]|nr:4-phosphoerythronate dehydrogenase [Fibrobacteria bacterium]
MHILVDENIPQGREVFSAYGTVTTFHGRQLTAADVRASGAEALLVRSITKVNASLLEGSNIKFVGTATIGVDHIDHPYLKAHGIGFSAAPGCNARSVAEYFVAALLNLHVRHGLYPEGFDDKTLGVVGHGNVGKQVAAIAPALGLNVLVSDPPLQDAGATPPPGGFHTLHELAARCDVITFHTPLTKTGAHPTLGMADAAFFAALAKPVVLMNMGRGEAFDEEAVIAARDRGLITHLVLDVFPGEPHVNPELGRRAVVISPHIAGYSIQGKLNGTTQVHDAFCRHFGFAPKGGVDYPPPAAPVIDFAALNVPSDATVETALDAVVRHAYDISRDDDALRASLGQPDSAASFDLLRKRYPVRQEFAGFTVVNLGGEKKSRVEKLSRLGFQVENAG